MFRRKPAAVDPLLHAPLPARIEHAHSVLAHQGDPALIAALSERELREERAAAEQVRDHQRHESVAAVKSAQTIAGEVRRAQEEMVRAEAADLVVARRAITERLRSSSPTFDIARLHREKKLAARGLTGVVIASMLWSAANVQHNLAPGGPSDPLYWFSYALEATISVVLVVIMVSGASVSRWNITEGDERIRRFEIALLLGSIGLNVYPYLYPSNLKLVGAAVHAVAPVMVGVALFLHPVVQRRYGLAIDRAKIAADAEGDDITARLDALTATATATRTAPAASPAAAGAPADEDAVIAEFEAELRARDDAPATEQLPRATEESADTECATAHTTDRAQPIARDAARADTDRAPIARETVARASDEDAPIARDGAEAARATSEMPETAAREHPAPRAVEDDPRASIDRGVIAHEQEPIVDADRAPIAAHTSAELDTDHAPRAAHTVTEATEAEFSRAEETPADDAVARGSEPVDRARTAPITLVSIAREDTDRAREPRTDRARETSTAGALARATEPAPIARDRSPRATDHGPFDHELSRAEADRFARAVSDRGLSKQPVSVLGEIYLLASQGHTANAIGGQVRLAHSTVGRALERVDQVLGPRSV